MGLFDKKFCDICGGKIGLLGNRKLSDGNLCKDCAKKLSPFFTERKQSSVAEIKQHLQYREQNRQALNSFRPTRTLGSDRTMRIFIDDNQGKFVASRKDDFVSENADIIELSQVTSARFEVDESRTEIYDKDREGRSVSYNPPRYDYDYDIEVHITVNSPYFSEINFKVNSFRIEDRYTEEFRRYEQIANEIVMALNGNSMGGYQQMGGYNQPMNGYNQMNNQPMNQSMGGNYGRMNNQPMNQPMQNGYNQMNNQQMNGYNQMNGQPMQNGYGQPMNQQMQGGYAQQGMNPQMQSDFPAQQMNGYNQPMQQGYGQQPMQGGYQQMNNQQMNQPMNGTWYCPNCGTPNTANFCSGCGTPKQ